MEELEVMVFMELRMVMELFPLHLEAEDLEEEIYGFLKKLLPLILLVEQLLLQVALEELRVKVLAL
jgi:hypothetical protein